VDVSRNRCRAPDCELEIGHEGPHKCTQPAPPSGDKYHRKIAGLAACGGGTVTVDVYSVLTAFQVTIPGLQHSVKKLLCAGIRNKATRLQDLQEARDALDRAIEDAQNESRG